MPEKYAERPPTVSAVQFVGTPDSAMEVNNWLSNYGASVMYDSMRNRLVIQTSTGQFLTAENGNWIMQKPDLAISVMTAVEFAQKYEAVDPAAIQTPVSPPPEPDPEPEVVNEPTPDPAPEDEPEGPGSDGEEEPPTDPPEESEAVT